MTERFLVDRKEAAKALSLSVRKVDDLVDTKLLNVTRVGRRVLFQPEELERFARRGTK